MLATIIAVSAIVRGLFEIYAAIRLRKEIDDEWILGLSGAMSVIFGLLIMFRPGAGLIAIALLIGAYMLALGVFADRAGAADVRALHGAQLGNVERNAVGQDTVAKLERSKHVRLCGFVQQYRRTLSRRMPFCRRPGRRR